MPSPAKITHNNLSISLASYLMSRQEGEQLLSTRALAEMYEASLGSVSAAMNHLEEIGAVSISRRGRLGAFLERKQIGKLWTVFANGPLVVALTLPYFPKCEGLATALYSLLNGAGIPTYLIFIRGSLNRIEALRHGQCHIAVMSALAADELCSSKEESLLRLPASTYVQEHRVFVRKSKSNGTAARPKTVGYDPDSFDVEYLTKLEFKDSKVNLQPITFTQIDLHLEDTALDAAVTNSDFVERLERKGFSSRALSAHTKAIVGDRDTSAVFVVQKKAAGIKMIVKEILDPASVIDMQQKVILGQIVPRY